MPLPMPDPAGLNALLDMESKGTLPEGWKVDVSQLRALGIIPPALPGTGRPGEPVPPPALMGTKRSYDLPKPPNPMSTLSNTDNVIGAVAQGARGAKNAAVAAGPYIKEAVSDPTGLMAFGAATGALANGASLPLRAIAGAEGAVAGNVLKQGMDMRKTGRPINPVELGGAGFSGLTGELLSAIPFAPSARAKIDTTGGLVRDFFSQGKVPFSAHELTESAPLNFMATVAKTGMGGASVMRDMEEQQAHYAEGKLMDEANKLSPTGEATPDVVTGGKLIQEDLNSSVKDMHANSGYPAFLAKYGKLRKVEMDPETGQLKGTGPSVGQLQSERSSALVTSRAAEAANASGVPGAAMRQADALHSAELLRQKMMDILPASGQAEHTAISDAYKKEASRVDNPMAHTLRMGTKSDDVIPTILANKLKGYVPHGEGTAQSNTELIQKLQGGLTPEAWDQARADTLLELTRQAVDPETRLIDHDRLRQGLTNLSDTNRQLLFGSANPEAAKILQILDRTQSKSRVGGEAGRILTSLRQPAAVIAIAGAGLGLAGGALSAEGHNNIGMPAMIGAGGIILAPRVFARLLTAPSPAWKIAQKMIIDLNATAPGPARSQMAQHIVRYISDTTMSDVNAHIFGNAPTQTDQNQSGGGSGIPPPPTGAVR